MIMGFDWHRMAARLADDAGNVQPGGVILFKRNIEEAEQTHALLREVQKWPDDRCSAAWTWKAEQSIGFAMQWRGFRRHLEVAARFSLLCFASMGC